MGLKLPKITDQEGVKGMLAQINKKCPTGARNNAMIMIMYRAGLRVSEVCKLMVSDMNFNTGMIYVQQSKGLEGKKKDRYVPMDDDIINACNLWLRFKPDSQYFFSTLDGGIIDTGYLRKVCYRISDKAGVYIQDGNEKKKISPHKLRHTCFSELLREGTCNIREIQELAGHSDLNTTMIYTHVVMDEVQGKIKNRKSLTHNRG